MSVYVSPPSWVGWPSGSGAELTGEQVFGYHRAMVMAGSELGALHEAIDGLAALGAGVLDDEALHAAVFALQRERARLAVAAAALLGQWERRRAWSDDGSCSAPARLARETVCSHASAANELRRARQLDALPATAAAIDRGELSLDHVELLGRAHQPHRAATLRRDESLLVEQCAGLRYSQARRVVRYWCDRVDTETDHAPDADPVDAHLYASQTFEGAVALSGLLDAVGGAVFINELDRLERELFLTDRRDGRTRTNAQRRAAALVTMAQRSATAPADRRPARPLFTVLLGDRAFTELCELANGTVLRPGHLVDWLGTADLETILFDGPSTVVSVSKKRRFTGALRRAVEARDRHCQHPSGCDVPADRCDVDHILPRRRAGPTSQFNGRLECPAHNRRPDRHDHDARPRPERPVTRLDELRARLRWRILHEEPDEDLPGVS